MEVYHYGVWAAVCDDDDNWDLDGAQVVCRQLGFGPAITATRTYNLWYDYNTWLDGVNCFGFELNIGLCSHGEWKIGHCDYYAGVWCSSNGTI